FGCQRRNGRLGNDYSYPLADQISRKCRQLIILSVRPAVFDRNVFSLDITSIQQSLFYRCYNSNRCLLKSSGQKADHWHCLLLRTCEERPCCCAAECGDKFPPSHFLTQGTGQGIVAGPTDTQEVGRPGSAMSALCQKRTHPLQQTSGRTFPVVSIVY